ncbi:MAG: dockerin type I repeat-containing protein [Firmicutes bacterium]|nr:dockerin type I repeat-containing protein [Bacillota bacterium]MBQ9604606.1 dockerin type I repeat-containing protein [Bacillota bacterium]
MKKKLHTKKKLTAFLLIAALTTALPAAVFAAVRTDTAVVTTLYGGNIADLTQNDEYKAADNFYSLSDTNINRMASEHFQIIWGNNDTTNTINYDFIKGNLINLENIRSFYIEELEMKDIGVSVNPYITEKRKTNVYISNTGLSVFEDDWAYMSADSDGFGYLFLAPGAMRVDEPSWVLPHEMGHVFTYHQGGNIHGAWYEATANWFRDRYLGSEYYAYGGRTYGPTADFFAPYLLNSSYYVPHMLNWYDTWPLFIYISENPDNIDGLGMELMHKIFEYNQPDNTSMYDTIELLSGVDKKEILAGMSRRMATMDFTRQQYYLQRLDEALETEGNYAKIYTTLEAADQDGYQTISGDRAPMQTGFNIIPLSVDLSKAILKADFVNTSTESGTDFRVSLVTETAGHTTRYSNIVSGSGTAEISLLGDEKAAYLVVCATPDTIKNYVVDWDSKATDTDTRYTYKVKISTSDYIPIKGDVNKDSTLNELDIIAIMRHITGKHLINDPTSFNNADYDQNGTVNMLDAISIMNG